VSSAAAHLVLVRPKKMTASRKVAWVDIALALLYAGVFAWLLHASHKAAADAVRRYGHNVDSGALEYVAAVLYFAPVALLFASAAVCLCRGWPIRWYAHWVAVAGAVVPLFIPGVAFVAR
jgi:hypothetical protein